MKKGILIVIIILLVLVLLFSGWKMLGILADYRQGEAMYEEMDQFVSIPETTVKPTVATEPTEEITEPEAESVKTEKTFTAPEVDFKKLWKVNKDVVGWIYIPDTKVNYPILQGRNNDQYLRHMINGKYNTAGSIFLEAGIADDFSSRNNPIYGHNMKNGTMFADVSKYKQQKFYDEHPVGFLVTPEKTYTVFFFSGYVLSAYGNAWDTSFSEVEFGKWLDKACSKSYFASDVTPTKDHKVLTLSTCSYETDTSRFVVHGILEEYEP